MIAAAYKAVQDDNEEALRRIVATCADAPVREHVKKYKKGYFFLQIVGNGSIFLECNQVWERWDNSKLHRNCIIRHIVTKAKHKRTWRRVFKYCTYRIL